MAVLLLQSLIFLLQLPKPAPAGPPTPASRGRLCCNAGLTAPPYSHCWPGHTCCYSPVMAASHRSQSSKPSYSPLHGQSLSCLPRLRVVPFLGLTVVHHLGALGTVSSTRSMNDSHRKRTVHGEADSWDPRGPWSHARKCLLITRKKNDSSPC
jgi:hypothetical protein